MVVRKDNGLHFIDMLRLELKAEAAKHKISKGKKLVGCFGINDGSRDLLVGWVISKERRDHRHGPQGKAEGFSRHSKMLLNDMFKGW